MQVITVPGEFLKRVHDHVARTGEPLLEHALEAYEHQLSAWPSGETGYDLVMENEIGVVDSLGTWEEVAEFLGISPETLARRVVARGYPEECVPGYLLGETSGGSGSEDEEWDDEEEFVDNSVEPWEILDLIGATADRPTPASLLSDLQGSFEWDAPTVYPGVPPGVLEALDWLEGRGRFAGLATTYEGRPGWPEEVTWVPTATALSCLQFVLDRMGRGIRIELSQVGSR